MDSITISVNGVELDDTPSPPSSPKGSPALRSFREDKDMCHRCESRVYQIEKIGPIKGFVYHRTCLKCSVCDRQLDLKSFHVNQVDLSDREIYCVKDAPWSGKGNVGAEDIAIRSALKATKMSQPPKQAEPAMPAGRLDMFSLEIQHALSVPKVGNVAGSQDGSKIRGQLDNQSLAITHAIEAQKLQKHQKEVLAGHHYPAMPSFHCAREAIIKAQQLLEELQRAEEDKMIEKFLLRRKEADKKVSLEVQEEWEKKLVVITQKYESDMNRKVDKRDKKCLQELTLKFKKEQDDLEKVMTLKRVKRLDEEKRRLIELEQRTTADLVQKHSEQMLELVRHTEEEVLRQENGGSNGPVFVSTAFKEPPPPRPPKRKKKDLYADPSIFYYVDEQAINVAENEQFSYTQLVDELTQGLVSDLEKARAIFRWITVKDLNAMDFGETLTSDTPLGLLKGIKYGTETYHTLFMRLCSYAGLHCVDIKGHSKSVGYEPGMKIQTGKFTNTWNAVLIDAEWRFVQCNWGARHLVMSKDKPKESVERSKSKPTPRDKIKYQYDEHYFIPDSDEFIMEFWPHEAKWQLLEQPMTLEEFEQLPFVRSLFFHYGLDFVNQKKAIVTTDSRGACDIKLRMPKELRERLAFHFHLRLVGSELSDLDGVKLERFILQTVVDQYVQFNVHVPAKGEYHVEIFASLVDPSSNPFGQSFKLKCVCKYKIQCRELAQRMHPLPACASGEWGPMKAIRHFRIKPLTHFGAIIETALPIEMRFDIPRTLKFHVKLHCNNRADLEKLAYHELQGNVLVVHAAFPEDGQYGLDIYTRDPELQTEKRTMSHCCKYLINFSADRATPRGDRVIGAMINLGHLGMTPLSHREPVIQTEEARLFIEFKMTKAVEFSFDLRSETDPQDVPKASDCVQVSQRGYTICFIVSLPKQGTYIFSVLASDEVDNNNGKKSSLPPAYSYMIRYYRKAEIARRSAVYSYRPGDGQHS